MLCAAPYGVAAMRSTVQVQLGAVSREGSRHLSSAAPAVYSTYPFIGNTTCDGLA
jgi:hypothetical protein